MAISVNTFEGSSPHTRGALAAGSAEARPERIIPAYAGSTCHGATAGVSTRDHPRIRGEHVNAGDRVRIVAGSSPHTRGARSGVQRRRRSGRIIPAYAGSTIIFRSIAAFEVGSSPHTRGAQRLSTSIWRAWRIIPAYAGSTAAGRRGRRPAPDHPRIRGEHSIVKPSLRGLTGSSPHTRGARQERGAQLGSHRIIPAYAGSTRS